MSQDKKKTQKTKPKTTKPKESKPTYYVAVGRRKTAIARVRMFVTKSTSKSKEADSSLEKAPKQYPITINQKPFEQYFHGEKMRRMVEEPIKKVKLSHPLEMSIRVKGGGMMAQAEATRLGIARAFKEYAPDMLPVLKASHLLTRDPRMKERKKPGKKGARRGQQWSKR